MNIEQYGKTLKKEGIYDYYLNVVDQPKKYQSISRKKMLEEIITTYMYHGLETFINYHEYNALKHLIHDDYRESEENIYSDLCNRCLMVFNWYDGHKYVVLDELKDFIKDEIDQIDEKSLKKRLKNDELVIGIIKAYGALSDEELQLCLQHYHIKLDVYNIRYYKQYYRIYDGCIVDSRFDEDFIEQYVADVDFHFINKKSLINISKYDLDIDIHVLSILNDYLNQEHHVLFRKHVIRDLLYCAHKKHIVSTDEVRYYTKNNYYLTKLVNYCIPFIPSMFYRGRSLNEYRDEYDYGASDLIPQKDTDLFFKLYTGLLEYVNQTHRVLNSRYYKPLSNDHERIKVRDYILNHLQLIDDFVKENPFSFTKKELSLVKQFKYPITGRFVIMMYDNDYTYFMNEYGNFRVKGLNDPIYKLVPSKSLPTFVNTVLYQFNDYIIYDGLITSYPVTIKKKDVKDLLDLHFNGNVYTKITHD